MKICWYEDEELKIEFSKFPNLRIRYVMPLSSKEEISDINKKPFINLSELTVCLTNKVQQTVFEFLVPENYTWDGATIPRIFWRLIGSRTDNRFLIPSLIHDVLCENHDYVDNDRYFSTTVFERLLYVSKVNPLSRWVLKHSVDNFQKFCGWGI